MRALTTIRITPLAPPPPPPAHLRLPTPLHAAAGAAASAVVLHRHGHHGQRSAASWATTADQRPSAEMKVVLDAADRMQKTQPAWYPPWMTQEQGFAVKVTKSLTNAQELMRRCKLAEPELEVVRYDRALKDNQDKLHWTSWDNYHTWLDLVRQRMFDDGENTSQAFVLAIALDYQNIIEQLGTTECFLYLLQWHGSVAIVDEDHGSFQTLKLTTQSQTDATLTLLQQQARHYMPLFSAAQVCADFTARNFGQRNLFSPASQH